MQVQNVNTSLTERLCLYSWNIANADVFAQTHALSRKVARWADLKSESGVTALEYGMIAGLIAVVIITAVTGLGTKLSGTFTSITAAMP